MVSVHFDNLSVYTLTVIYVSITCWARFSEILRLELHRILKRSWQKESTYNLKQYKLLTSVININKLHKVEEFTFLKHRQNFE
jgi:hypothetical protein